MKRALVTAAERAKMSALPNQGLVMRYSGAIRTARSAIQTHHVSHELHSAIVLERQELFRLKLNRFDRQFPVRDAHDDAIIRFGVYFKAGR